MIRRNEIGVVFGRKGSGKTYWARGYVDKYSGPVLIWDSAADFAGPACAHPVRNAAVFYGFADVLEAASAGRFDDSSRIVVQEGRNAAGLASFERACAWTRRAGNMLFVVDEVDLFCSPSRIPDALSDCVSLGRHSCLDMLFLARRPAEVHREITSQADWIRAFKTTEPRDLVYLEQVGGKVFAESVRNRRQFASSVHVSG